MWIQINVDASRSFNSRSTTVGYIMDHKHVNSFIATRRQIGECLFLWLNVGYLREMVLTT